MRSARSKALVSILSKELLKFRKYSCHFADVIFIGPNDLALALLGYAPAKGTETTFQEAIDRIVSTAKKHCKKVGILARDGERAKEAKTRFDFVALGADARALQAWYRAELDLARS